MKFGIATFPGKKIQDFANSYRKRYDPNYALIPPHITLKEPFELEEKMLPQAVEHLEQVAQETAPFNIHFHKISSFHPTNNVVYIAVENPDEMKQLHEKINRGHLYHERGYKFIPHITIGQKLPQDELLDVYGSLRMLHVDMNSWVDRFHLLYQLENGSWTIYQSFLLRG
ncbi:putative phosphoesterase YjcG [Kroppenstedtia guangzhouensis]|uniref:Putative phosphoesterase GCM10007416_00260 n=1 Tax=Kroppenstedtia guangzhouensis TaxID=1274356 RepID=A0ABQ1FYK5_9BACL|nr:YjcG family protein [Kroppenstedtia guangzhouensis]GGA31699.1 putative phosphoesterase YjcG [Kroppenstedtia guangzhouensis]